MEEVRRECDLVHQILGRTPPFASTGSAREYFIPNSNSSLRSSARPSLLGSSFAPRLVLRFSARPSLLASIQLINNGTSLHGLSDVVETGLCRALKDDVENDVIGASLVNKLVELVGPRLGGRLVWRDLREWRHVGLAGLLRWAYYWF